MAKPVYDVIDEIVDALRRTEQAYMTMSWEKFYDLNDISRFKSDRRDQLADRGVLKVVILGYGDNVVIACRDRDFAPGMW